MHHNHRCSLMSLPSMGLLHSLLSGYKQGDTRRPLGRWAWAYWRWRACRGMRRCARACCSWPSAWRCASYCITCNMMLLLLECCTFFCLSVACLGLLGHVLASPGRRFLASRVSSTSGIHCRQGSLGPSAVCLSQNLPVARAAAACRRCQRRRCSGWRTRAACGMWAGAAGARRWPTAAPTCTRRPSTPTRWRTARTPTRPRPPASPATAGAWEHASGLCCSLGQQEYD